MDTRDIVGLVLVGIACLFVLGAAAAAIAISFYEDYLTKKGQRERYLANLAAGSHTEGEGDSAGPRLGSYDQRSG